MRSRKATENKLKCNVGMNAMVAQYLFYCIYTYRENRELQLAK